MYQVQKPLSESKMMNWHSGKLLFFVTSGSGVRIPVRPIFCAGLTCGLRWPGGSYHAGPRWPGGLHRAGPLWPWWAALAWYLAPCWAVLAWWPMSTWWVSCWAARGRPAQPERRGVGPGTSGAHKWDQVLAIPTCGNMHWWGHATVGPYVGPNPQLQVVACGTRSLFPFFQIVL